MNNFFDWHVHLTGSIPVKYWSNILSQRNQLGGRTIDNLKSQLYIENSSAWSELKVCTDTEEGFRDTVIFVVEDMLNRGVRGANFIFNPHSLINRGLDISKTFENLHPFLQHLIDEGQFYPLFRMGVNRRDGLEELEKIAKLFKQNKDKYLWLEAIDINGDEQKYSLKPFISQLLELNKESIPYTIHAGEGFELTASLEHAIKCSPIRIGHGVASVFDDSLIKEIKEKKIALELCVSSNLETFNIPLEEYPLVKLFDTGVDIVLGSDNPSFINSNIEDEYSLVSSVLGDQPLESVGSVTERYLRRSKLI
ncbi:MAG: hypothetical protein WCY37_01630 [Candidatus Dojkabacteria bacterium]